MTKKTLSEYEFVPSMSRTKRVAHFLDWAAKHMPKELHPFNIIAKAINGFKHLPRLDSKESDLIKSVSSSVRKVLLNEYKRGMTSVRGLGIRATVDDADMVIYDVAKKAERATAAMTSFTASVNIVTIANIPKTPEMAPHLRYIRQAKEVATLFGSAEFMQKLLPPKIEKKEEEK